MINLNSNSSVVPTSQQISKIDIKDSTALNNSRSYNDEKQIKELHQQNIVEDYFRVFDTTNSEVTIKNLIAARLQPSYQLPKVHDTEKLSAKMDELLGYTLSA